MIYTFTATGHKITEQR